MMNWDIPLISDKSLPIILNPGDRVFMVGANGSGKSALIQHLVSSNKQGIVKRISAHRQTWLASGSISMTPKDREQFSQINRDWEKELDSRWVDHNADQKLSSVLFDLVAKENFRARTIAYHVDEDTGDASTIASRSPSPFKVLNDLLALGTLTVSLEHAEGEEIRARHGSNGTTFSMAQMSDGERNAAVIAATVLTVKPGTVLLIDEPERHLHRAIIEPFLSALFAQRADCAFVVSTHEIALPAANPEARVLMIRSCRWNGDRPDAWDVEILEPKVNLPEDLKRAILGSRRRILFVEGTLNSLDSPLYDALFPGLSVIPMGGCREVERAVKGLRKTRDHHHTEAFGLIDRDDRTAEDVDRLARDGVFALDVCSAESLYYCSAVIDAVARKQAEARGCDANGMFCSAKQAAFDAIRDDPDLATRMAARRCERRIRDAMLAEIPDWKKIKDGGEQKITARVHSSYSTELGHFKELIDEGNLDALVARYPLRESRVPDKIAKALECTSRRDYERIAVKRVQDDTAALAEKLKQRMVPLCRALEGADRASAYDEPRRNRSLNDFLP